MFGTIPQRVQELLRDEGEERGVGGHDLLFNHCNGG